MLTHLNLRAEHYVRSTDEHESLSTVGGWVDLRG